MIPPRDTLTITVEYHDGQEEGDVGYPYYVATNDEIGLVTDGKTFEELRANLVEALDACLGDINTVAEYNLVPNPHVELRMPFAYGKTVLILDEDAGAVQLVPVTPPPKSRKAGSARGQIRMSADFDAPLDDFNEYME